ncbi:YadA family autotransporter adhesin [Alcaligenes sp. Marseille-Q7550]
MDLSSSDGNIVLTQTGTDVNLTLSKDLALTNVTVQGNTTVNNLTATGVTRLGDHFTVNQGGDVHYDGPITENTHIVNKEYVDNSSQAVIDNNPLTFKGSDGSTTERKLGETLEVVGSNGNITTEAKDGKLTIALNDDLKVENVTVNQNLTVNGDTILNNLTTTGVTKLGDHFTVNQGGDVHYDGPITENTHIVNKEYVDNSSQNVINNNPLTFKGSDGSTTDRKLGETLVVEGSNSNIATHAQDGKLTIALNDDLDLNSVKTGNTTMNKDGVVVLDEDGKPSIVMNNKGFSVGDNVALTSNGLKAFDVVINQQGINAGGHKITNVAAGTADTDAVNVSQLKQVEQNLTDRAVKYDLNSDGTVNKGKVSMEGDKSTDGGRTGGTGITNVARGDISSNSTDAVNGSQISDMGDSIAQGMGVGSRFENGKLVTELNVGGNTYNNVNDALGGLDNKIDNIGQVASAGWNIRTNGDVADKVAPGSTVQFLNGDNIEITRSGLDVKVALAQDIKVNSVVAKSVTTNELKIENGPTINQNGIDMHDKTISNVADGKAPQDAVNVRQLGQATANIQGQINHLDGRINKVENRANAGIAAALATAGLPQAYMPGKSMFSVAGGAWNGESGYAMGLSTVSDNGSWVLKGTVAGSSRGDYGGSVGVGYQW